MTTFSHRPINPLVCGHALTPEVAWLLDGATLAGYRDAVAGVPLTSVNAHDDLSVTDTPFGPAPRSTSSHTGTTASHLSSDDPSLDVNHGDLTLLAVIAFTQQPPDEFSGTHFGAITGQGNLGTASGYQLLAVDDALEFQVRSGATNQRATGGTNYRDGAFHTLVGVLERGSTTGVRLYVDGVVEAVADATPLDGQSVAGG